VLLPDLIVRSRRVVTTRGTLPASIHVRGGRIIGVSDYDAVPAGVPVDEAGEAALLPGVVDSHVHVNEPGRTEWEGFDTATRAAAAGGVTTIIDMPLNSIPATTTVEGLEAKRRAAAGACFVDVGFWGGVIPGNTAELSPLFEAGVFGFKCFLVPSGVDEFPHVVEDDLRQALPLLARIGAPLLAHAELPGPIEQALALRGPTRSWSPFRARSDARTYANYLDSRPKAAENDAIALLIRLCGEYGARTHIVHLSSSDALTPIFRARSAHLPITVETCPHYLFFVAEEIPAGATAFKCAPPIRERANRELLWAALAGDLIQAVVSDHSPAPPAMKQVESGDFMKAWGGIASLQLGLSIVWTEARARGYTLDHVARWMGLGPARVAGLERKGAIDVGYSADLVVFDTDGEFVVEGRALFHRHHLTPYEGRRLSGIVRRTYLRGQKIYTAGQPFGSPSGELLVRPGMSVASSGFTHLRR
jgi:allantoinase